MFGYRISSFAKYSQIRQPLTANFLALLVWEVVYMELFGMTHIWNDKNLQWGSHKTMLHYASVMGLNDSWGPCDSRVHEFPYRYFKSQTLACFTKKWTQLNKYLFLFSWNCEWPQKIGYSHVDAFEGNLPEQKFWP